MTTPKPRLTIGQVRKALVIVAAVIGQALTLGLLHGNAEHYATLALGVLGAIGVYAVPNDHTTAPKRP